MRCGMIANETTIHHSSKEEGANNYSLLISTSETIYLWQ